MAAFAIVPGFNVFNEPVSYQGRLLKIPTAFFKTSTSSLSRAFSLFSTLSSSSGSLSFPGKALSPFFLVFLCHFLQRTDMDAQFSGCLGLVVALLQQTNCLTLKFFRVRPSVCGRV
jgi:hypothetical protein